MSDYSFTLNDLDTLSSVLPHLTSISLIDCTLLPDNKHASALIEPATSVTSLSLDKIEIDVRSLEIEAELLMYISKKYPNLSTITYANKTHYYHMPTEANNRYRTAWLALFIALKSQLRTLKFQRMAVGLNVCGLLDIAGCQVQRLHLHSKRLYPLCENLLASNQTRFIRNLTIEVQEFNTSGYQWLRELHLLKKLKWIIQVYPHNPFTLNELVKLLPDALEALSLKSMTTQSHVFDFKASATTRSLSLLKNVSLCNIAITKEIESFLVNVTPRLHSLKLYQCNVNIPSLSFPNTRFTLLKIAHDFQSMYQNVILTTAINNETRRYTAECWSTMENQFKYLFGAHDTPMYPSVECSPNVDFDFKPYIRIRCYSVHDFIIIDHC
ncbi:hypothetical protein K501DRAFT_333272 [Backusella circina FSU 941]|nr:hypothetical protein K501DRAFT_333272 [Backusella circina FSU 941]